MNTNPLIVVCSSCHRQRIGDDETGVWVDAPAGGYPKGANISHSACDPCNEARYIAMGLEPPSKRSLNNGTENAINQTRENTMARASCWTATSVDGPCGKYDGPALPHCEGCARYPVKPIQDVSFAGVWAALAKVETDYLLQRQEVLRKIGELTEKMSADAVKVKP